MTDVSFPAHLTVTRDHDRNGVPILTATVTPAVAAASLPLPEGPKGATGPRGQTRAPFVKAGAIANIGARPGGLDAADRGRWWHRLDNGSMDVWDGAGWRNSPGAVGPAGPAAPSNEIVAQTTHDPALTVPAAQFVGTGASQVLALTAPAGEPGNPGPPGASGSVATATDYDATTGPTRRSMFGYSQGARRWRVTPPPLGFGFWSWAGNDFNADAEVQTGKLTAGTFVVPALPFRWRPYCWAHLRVYCQQGHNADGIAYVRLGSVNGVMVATGEGAHIDNAYHLLGLCPSFGDEGTKPIGPSSTYATIPAYTEATFVVTAERVGDEGSDATIGYQRANASLVVLALPA